MDSNKLWFLKRINLLRSLDSDGIQRVDRVATHRRVQRRELIFGPEDRGDAIYLLKQGRVKLSRFDDRGREITLAILEEGEFFGEEALAGAERRNAYAEALEESLVCRVDRADFESLLEDHPTLALDVAKQISERLLGARERIEALAFQDVPQRLAAVLTDLARTHGAPDPDGGIRIQIRLTHQELASLVVSTRETTTTLLNRFKREGLLDTEGRWLVVRDPEGLAALASPEA